MQPRTPRACAARHSRIRRPRSVRRLAMGGTLGARAGRVDQDARVRDVVSALRGRWGLSTTGPSRRR